MTRSVLIVLCIAATVRVASGQRGAAGTSPGAPPQFTNVASAAGLDFRHVNGGTPDRHLLEIMGSGGLFFDYDEDGWVDVFLVDGGSLVDAKVDATARDRLYRTAATAPSTMCRPRRESFTPDTEWARVPLTTITTAGPTCT